MSDLNYHHLRYFHAVAHDGNLTRTAERLNLSQSALSSQIKALEERFGQKLFDRVGRRLELTEIGRIALDHADRIFGTGAELLATLNQSSETRQPLRIGALSTLSRNFQLAFLKPVLGQNDVDIKLTSGNAERLLNLLKSLALDVVLTTQVPARDARTEFIAHRISEQPVGLHGVPDRLQHGSLKSLLKNEPLIVPSDPVIRSGFDSLVMRLGVEPRVVADVDDMAMVRLLAREGVGLAIAPAVVLADEIASGLLRTAPYDLRINEDFFAVTIPRSFPHPLLSALL
ncbi:LysR family transcriptional regulator [Roseovarius phycicola]|uniref:LysR family transcriptional regulator n=1 Tax=Roseovarius phycicola TaxID=3080976 RepID=A0ABZ2HLN5_9RHOB